MAIATYQPTTRQSNTWRFSHETDKQTGRSCMVYVPSSIGRRPNRREERIGALLRALLQTTTARSRLRSTSGVSKGQQIWYIVAESSGGDTADELGVNRARKLKNARNTRAVQRGWFDNRACLNFTATMDFSPNRVVVPAPNTGFPPVRAVPGARGKPGYSPLVELFDGTIRTQTTLQTDTPTLTRSA